MDEKTHAIESQILKGMPGCSVHYQFAGGLHKFRVEGSTSSPTHWLYLSREVVADSAPVILINLLSIYHVVDTFNKAMSSKWLFLSVNGIREVDDSFAKER